MSAEILSISNLSVVCLPIANRSLVASVCVSLDSEGLFRPCERSLSSGTSCLMPCTLPCRTSTKVKTVCSRLTFASFSSKPLRRVSSQPCLARSVAPSPSTAHHHHNPWTALCRIVTYLLDLVPQLEPSPHRVPLLWPFLDSGYWRRSTVLLNRRDSVALEVPSHSRATNKRLAV